MTTNFCRIVIWQVSFWLNHWAYCRFRLKHLSHCKMTAGHLLASKGPKFMNGKCSALDLIERTYLTPTNPSTGLVPVVWLACGHSLCKLLSEKATKVKCLLGDHHHPPKFQPVAKTAFTQSAHIATLSKELRICSACECLLEMLIIPMQYNNVLRALQHWHEH